MSAKNPSAARESLLDRISLEFDDLKQRLTIGFQLVLEANDVAHPARQSVAEFMAEAVSGLATLETDVVKLVDAWDQSHYLTLDDIRPESTADLLCEWRADEAAAKRADAHHYGDELRKIVDGERQPSKAEPARD